MTHGGKYRSPPILMNYLNRKGWQCWSEKKKEDLHRHRKRYWISPSEDTRCFK